MEEGLRHGGLGAVVGEVARLSMTASRRLQLAAEGGGAIAIALRRWRRQTEAADYVQPTAAMTCWRISVLPRSEEHTSGLQSVMRISYAVFCLKKKRSSLHIVLFIISFSAYLFLQFHFISQHIIFLSI